jgi:hypothetical protein
VESVREARRVSFGVAPAWPWNASHDVTLPVPALRLGVSFSPRVTVDLTAGTIHASDYSGASLVEVGARYFFADGNASPYLMVRVGEYFADHDESPDRTYGYAALGPGIEYAADNGFTAWAEAGPVLIDSDLGAYASVGLGYRFGSRPK